MNTIICLFLGGLIGGGIGLALEVGAAIISCVTCSDGDSVALCIPLAIVGAVIGLLVGIYKDVDAAQRNKEMEAQRLANEATQRWQNWSNQLNNLYEKIINDALHVNASFDPVLEYEQIKKMRSTMDGSDARYLETYRALSNSHEERLRNNLYTALTGEDPKFKDMSEEERFEELVKAMAESLSSGVLPDSQLDLSLNLASLCLSVNILKCLFYLHQDDKLIIDAYEGIREATLAVIQQPLIYLEQREYGDFNLRIDDDIEFKKMSVWISKNGMSEFSAFTSRLRTNTDNILNMAAEGEFIKFIETSCRIMWYYAKLKPFDVEKFNAAAGYFNTYSRKNSSIVKVESLLAQIYAKNQLGGQNLVQQDMKLIDEWIHGVYEYSSDDCTLFASGLAWMELFEIERHVLRKLVEYGVPLPADIQERLSFLESGGTANIKLYQITPTNDYMFDNSSLDWDNNDYGVFFRKLAMKKMNLNYSMAYSKWTKTLPLASGQKVSFESIVEEFKALVADFDGEVITYTTVAKAVNLVNLEYPNAVIFKFTSERNRCIEMMFYCEKYGRNLNITIITMFAPDNTLPVESLEKYCSAIKNNMYIDSFKESILQSVDVVVKEKQSVYGDEIVEPKKKTIME